MSEPSQYPVTIQRLSAADGGGFAAYALDLPGCVSDGETPNEAVSNLQDAILCWIEAAEDMGRPIPKPSPDVPEPMARFG